MPRLALARGYSRQPAQGAKPDLANTLTKGLVSLTNFGVAHPLGRAWDVVTNTPWTQTGSAALGNSRQGRALTMAGSAGSLTNAGLTLSTKITGPWTVFMLVSQSASGTAVVASSNTQTAPYCASFTGTWSISNTANGSVAANATMQAVAFRQFATTADVTVNGVKGTAASQSYAAWAAGAAYLGDFGSGGGFPLNGQIALCAIFNRALSDYEIKQLTTNPWQLFRAPASPLERMLNVINTTYNVSLSDTLAALDQPNRNGAANYTVAVTENGAVVEAPAALSVLAVAAVEALGASDTVSVPSAVPVITLQQYWLKNYQTTTQAALQSGYSNPITIAGGSALVALWAGWDATRQIPIPTINTGGPLANFTDAGSTASVLHPNQMTQAMAGVANLSAGSYTVSVPNILDPDSTGSQGEIGVWMLEITNLGTSFTVVDVNAAHRNNSSSSWSISTDTSPQVGDLVLIIGTMENSVAVGSSGVAGPAGFTQIGINNDGTNFIPTQLAYKVLTSGGTVTATWTATDPNKTEDFGMIVVLRPAQAASPITGSVSESLTAADAPGAIGTMAAALSEAGSAVDSVTSSGNASFLQQSETGVASDSSSAIETTAAAMTEVGTAADAQVAGTTTGTTLSEGGAASDSSLAQSTQAAVASEAGAASDVTSNVTSTLAGIGESVTAVDTDAVVVSSSPSTSDTLSSVDATSAAGLFVTGTDETAAASDSVSTSGQSTQTVSEVGLAFSLEAASAVFNVSSNDSGAASDSVSESFLTTALLSEAGTAADTSTSQNFAAGGMAEQADAEDIVGLGASVVVASVAETENASEIVTQLAFNGQAVQETGAAVDLTVGTANGQVTITEQSAAGDTSTASMLTLASAQEQVLASDLVALAGAGSSAAVVETLAAADLTAQTAAAALVLADSLNAQDSVAVSALIAAIVQESGVALDVEGIAVAYQLTAQEAMVVVDSISVPQESTLSISEILSSIDVVRVGSGRFDDLLYGFGLVETTETIILRTTRADQMVITITRAGRKIVV